MIRESDNDPKKDPQNPRRRVPVRTPGRPRLEDQTDVEGYILEEACRLFLAYGYAAVSISAITGAVGITKSTLYYYFPDKESVYTTVLVRLMERAHREMMPILSSGQDYKKTLYTLSEAYLRCRPLSISFLLRDVHEHVQAAMGSQLMATYEQLIMLPLRQFFDRLLQASGRDVKFSLQDSRLLSRVFVGVLDSMATHFSYPSPGQEPVQNVAHLVVDTYLSGVR